MGLEIILDTNVVLYHLAGRIAENPPERGSGISVVTEMELLSYPLLSDDEGEIIRKFLFRVQVVGLTEEVKHEAIRIRRQTGLKLPDSIILATAFTEGGMLWTADERLLGKVGIPVRRVQPLLPH